MNRKGNMIARVALTIMLFTIAASSIILQVRAEDSFEYWLPFAARQDKQIGVQIEGAINTYNRTPFVIPAGIYQYPLKWDDIEATQGVYTWPTYFLENETVLDGFNARTIIGFKLSPRWARKDPDEKDGSPPLPTAYGAYAAAANAMIATAHPWGIELWNEPNVLCWQACDGVYGCWVPTPNAQTTATVFYKGGKDYGKFVATVYPLIKTPNPNVQIIVGAINGYREDDQLAFVDGMLAASPQADYYSMHRYVPQYATPTYQVVLEDVSAFATRVGKQVILSETGYYRNTDQHGALPTNDYVNYESQKNGLFEYIKSEWPSHPELFAWIWYTQANNYWFYTDFVQDSEIWPGTPMSAYCNYSGTLNYQSTYCPTFTFTPSPTASPTPTNTPSPTPTYTPGGPSLPYPGSEEEGGNWWEELELLESTPTPDAYPSNQ